MFVLRGCIGSWRLYSIELSGGTGAGNGNVNEKGMWDMGCGIWDVGYGMWDMGTVVRSGTQI